MNYDNLTLLTDLYELTMVQGYLESGLSKKFAAFDLFYRENPSRGGYAIAAGLEQAINYLRELKFSAGDLKYLDTLGVFNDNLLNYLKNFKFVGDVYAIPEGSVVFPNEPLITVVAPIAQAQLVETALLTIINHQSLIATKASRVARAAKGDMVFEFGLRRAQGPDAGIYGARAALIGGCNATSNVIAGKMFDIPVKGTHAHSWVMSFDDELTAFREYVKAFPNNCTLLADTYDTLESGVPNAIKVFAEMKKAGALPEKFGIRLDSGDLAYISKRARKALDAAGFAEAFICASSDLDEYLIEDLKLQGAQITVWGVGTNLITSKDCPSFGGVYKLAAESDDGINFNPKIKLSENPVKVTNPGVKKIYRLFDSDSNKIRADLICLADEIIDDSRDLTIFHPEATWKRMTLKAGTYYAEELLIKVFDKGAPVYSSPSVMEIRDFSACQQTKLWDESKRFLNPHVTPVDLSAKLYDLKQKLLAERRRAE